MKRLLFLPLIMIGLSALAFGQSLQVVGFVAPGRFSTAGKGEFGFQFGGGPKYITSTGLGVGAEIALSAPKEKFSSFQAGTGSFNGYYVFKLPAEKVEPFVTGGYTRTFLNRMGGDWGNFGGGVTVWSTQSIGILTEFRGHLRKFQANQEGADKMWVIRIGVVAR